ncbi:MAG: 2Fe-2S iron-sulfur cluster binding domain-containing protein [Candidatus Nitronauta litoralis]|uniref:2Fe-2S iron-sulfur cluster binding domain-containing protein n=1 Tax=Candidatus Nitronauta litoralis TaxID=2705533 RepID=A0A7T0G0F9_9BACT|nr:MAG: 2Fe-2S iron-sulfur cluster binding domain-containing protein [Candidatus Nitronauta litoralis]
MSFQIYIDKGKSSFNVLHEESILDGSIRNGVHLPHGCSHGECGNCRAKVTKGEWSYLHGYSPGILSKKEIEQGWIIVCKAEPKSDLELQIPRSGEINFQRQKINCCIEKIEAVAEDVFKLLMKIPKDKKFYFHPGQYVNFILAENRKRAFSLASLPDESGVLEFHIKRIRGGFFSEFLLDILKTGDEICIEGPYGKFHLDEESNRPTLFIAGETGFAPIRPMIEKRLEKEDSAPVRLYWGVPSSRHLYLKDQINKWERRYQHFKFIPVSSDLKETWNGRRGQVHKAVVEDNNDLSPYDVYMAGPLEMFEIAGKVLPAFGLNEDRCFSERFSFGNNSCEQKSGLIKLGLKRLFGKR